MSAALPPEDLDLVLSLTPAFWSQYAGSRLLITGGTGFIGSWLVQVVQRANDRLESQLELLVLTRNPGRARQQSPHLFERADTRLVAGDVSTLAVPVGALDLCIHAAAEVGNPHRADQPLQVFDTIVQGTRRMLDLAQTAGARRFLLASSGAVYGPQPSDLERMPESYGGAPDPINVANAYGNGKRAAEWLACAYGAQASFSPTIARIFAVLGPGLPLDGPFAAGNFIRDALAGRAININGDGTPLRSYLYTADLCVWLLRILESGTAGQAYNVGSEHALSIASLAQRVVEVAGHTVPIHVQTPPDAAPPQLPTRYIPDTSKARQALDLAEYTMLDTALRKTMQWTRSTTMGATR
jgi:dTDP-glucose 4,6-dehydratase